MPIKRPGWTRYVKRHGVGQAIRFSVGTFKRAVPSKPKGGGWKKPVRRSPGGASGPYAEFLNWADKETQDAEAQVRD